MSRVAFVQINSDGMPANINCYAAWEGFRERGFDVRLFTPDELPTLPLNRDSVLHGGIPVVFAALRQLGAAEPPYLNYPEPLRPFLGRRVWETTLGDIRNNEALWPVFIKPADRAKLFTGYVVYDIRWLRPTVGLPNDLPVFAQEPVTFLSEWRLYVLRGQLLGIGHYKGDPLRFPDKERIQAMLAAHTDAPVAHSLDVGVLTTGETVLVEVNDGYSLGNYGLPPTLYVQMIEARWLELVSAR